MNYSIAELQALGVQGGRNAQVHRTVQFFNPDRVRLGSNVRIDCFSVISAGEPVVIGNHVHLSAGTAIFGTAGVEIGDFAGLSSRTTLYSVSDDYSDGYMTNPTVPAEYRKVQSGKVVLRAHVIVGAGSVILPGITLERGVSVGALSLVNKSIPEFMIVSGIPVRRIGMRNQARLDQLERDFKSRSQIES